MKEVKLGLGVAVIGNEKDFLKSMNSERGMEISIGEAQMDIFDKCINCVNLSIQHWDSNHDGWASFDVKKEDAIYFAKSLLALAESISNE